MDCRRLKTSEQTHRELNALLVPCRKFYSISNGQAEPLAYATFETPLARGAVRLGVFRVTDAADKLATEAHNAAQSILQTLPPGWVPLSERGGAWNPSAPLGRRSKCNPCRCQLRLLTRTEQNRKLQARLNRSAQLTRHLFVPVISQSVAEWRAGWLVHENQKQHYHLTIQMISHPSDPRPDAFVAGGGIDRQRLPSPIPAPTQAAMKREQDFYKATAAAGHSPILTVRRWANTSGLCLSLLHWAPLIAVSPLSTS